MIPELALQPADGELDVDAIAKHLDGLDEAARDPHSVAVLHPGPRMIALTTMTSDTRPSRAFVEWLRRERPIRILDQELSDLTHRCRDSLDAVFGEPD